MMDRRTFILSSAAGFVVAPITLFAQQPARLRRIGYLTVGTLPIPTEFWTAMRGFGWVDGRNVVALPRYAQTWRELRPLVAELINLEVDLIMTNGSPSTRAAKRATNTIPIVFSVAADPIENDFVFSLARPGGNLTGFQYGTFDEKQVEVLKDAVPGIVRVAWPVLEIDANSPIPDAVRGLGAQIQFHLVRTAEELINLCATARKSGDEAVLFADVAWPFTPEWARIAAEAVKHRLPTIGHTRQFVEAGGLMCYGPVQGQHWPRVAAQIDRIFRGAKPADIAVELSSKFELFINAKTAKALGLTIPASLLQRADEVIQ